MGRPQTAHLVNHDRMPELPHSTAIAMRLTTLAGACALLAACSITNDAKPIHASDPTTAPPKVKMTSEDFRGVCQGATASHATRFDPQTKSHKVILFTPLNGSLIEDTGTLPPDWMVHYDAATDAYTQVDLVACVDVTAEQSLKECTGYQDKGHDIANKVDLRRTTYAVSVHSAVSGDELGRTSLSSNDDTCPLFMSFDDDTQTKPYNVPPPKDDLIAFIKQFVQP